MSIDYDAVLLAARNAAAAAGAKIRQSLKDRVEKGLNVIVKGGVDLVTEVDQACEADILAALKAEFPTHTFVGEESEFAAGSASTSKDAPAGPTWFVDPLDGTTNFVHGYPFVTVSIGFAVDGQPMAGVIYNPIMDEMYYAAPGKGAFMNDRPIHVSGAKTVKEAMVMNNIGASRDAAFVRKTLARLEELCANTVQALRNSGSAAQNMAHVASGCLDVYYEDGYGGPWDVVAGIAIVKEAGGVVMAPEGTPFTLKLGKGKVMVGPEAVCRDVARVIRQADARSAASSSSAFPFSGCPLTMGAHLATGAAAGIAVAATTKGKCPTKYASGALIGAGAIVLLQWVASKFRK